MAVLTDLLVAPATDATAIIEEWPATRRWLAFQSTGLDTILLAELAEALAEPDLVDAIEALEPLAFADEAGGPWIYLLPEKLRDRLADLTGESIAEVASIWAGREQATNLGLSADIAQDLLHRMQDLASEARKSGHPLLLWISL